MSRTMPPPTAVMTPSMTAGSHHSPASSVFCAPAAAQHPTARASRRTSERRDSVPVSGMKKATAPPANAQIR